MQKIIELYEKHISHQSDIQEHVSTLREYSAGCSHVTEFGVRYGLSTIGLLMGNPKKMISYDLEGNDSVDEIVQLTKEYNMDYTFIEGNTLDIKIEPTELLFIDTNHSYNHLKKELNLHNSKVSKFIIMHDTVSFGFVSQYQTEENKNKGLVNAIYEFIQENPNWAIYRHYTNNNGLMVLKNNKLI